MKYFDPWEHIDEYLRGELSEEVRSLFEDAIAINSELNDELSIRKDVHLALELDARLRLREQIRKRDNNDVRKGRNMFQKSWPVAASFLFIIVAAGIVYSNLRYSDSAISRRHTTAFEDRISILGGTHGSLSDAIASYNEQQYPTAIEQFRIISDLDSNFDVAQLYLGVSYVLMKDYSPAIEVLESQRRRNNQFNDITSWYLSLAYLGSGDNASTLNLLKEIQETGVGYREQEVQEVLRELSSPWRRFTF